MKVSELILELQKACPDDEVLVSLDLTTESIDEVEVLEFDGAVVLYLA